MNMTANASSSLLTLDQSLLGSLMLANATTSSGIASWLGSTFNSGGSSDNNFASPSCNSMVHSTASYLNSFTAPSCDSMVSAFSPTASYGNVFTTPSRKRPASSGKDENNPTRKVQKMQSDRCKKLADAFAATRRVVDQRRPNCGRKMEQIDIIEEILDMYISKEKELEELKKQAEAKERELVALKAQSQLDAVLFSIIKTETFSSPSNPNSMPTPVPPPPRKGIWRPYY